MGLRPTIPALNRRAKLKSRYAAEGSNFKIPDESEQNPAYQSL
jgi:hypothetical protein